MEEYYSLSILQTEYQSLYQGILSLKDQVARLTALRDDLLYHICPSLQAEYEEKIACLERELLAAQLYLREKQRIIEILQAQMNQDREPSFSEAEQSAHEENREYQDDLKRKAKEAEDFHARWRKESNWYEYDDGYRNREEDKDMGTSDRDHEDDGPEHNHEDPGQQNGEETDRGKTKKESKGSELKRLYRKIVKLLHPDVHPDPTPKEKELLNKAIDAYNRGDLESIRKIWNELEGTGMAEEELFEDTPEGIARMREILERLRKRYGELEEEILHIRSSYPYTMKVFLDDEKAVETRQNELRSEIDRTREMDRQLEEYINQLKKQMEYA